MIKMEKAYTVRGVADQLGCSVEKIYHAIWEKRLRVKRKQGKQKYLISEKNLEKFRDSIRGKGKPAKGKKPSLVDLQRLYVKEQRSIRDIAGLLGCSKDAVYRTLEEYGIDRRSQARRSNLRRYELAFLEEKIKTERMGKAAESLGVSRKALWEYMKKHR